MTEILRPAPSSVTTLPRGRPSIRKSGGGTHGWAALLAMIALVALLVTSVLNILRIGYTYLTVYPVTARSITDPEPMRWAASNYGIVHLVNFANTSLDPTDRIFSFRQADLGYYANNPIAVYTDNTYAPLFTLKSAEALRSALLKEGIGYIALPPYGLAEVNNSAFSDLIGDPVLTRLVFDQDGNRLFQIVSVEPRAIELDRVRVVDTQSKAEREKWNATTMPMPLFAALRTPPATVTRDENGITLQRERPVIGRDDLEDVLQPWDISLETTPFVVGRSEFEVRDGQYLFAGRIAGDGEVNLYVDLYANYPGETVRRERKLVWSGVLDDETRDITGQFKVLFASDVVEEAGSRHLSARIFFGLKHGGYLTVKSLELQRLAKTGYPSALEAKQAQGFQDLKRAYRQGWKNLTATARTSVYSEPFDVFGLGERGAIWARQSSGNARVFTSPTYVLPTDLLTSETAFRMERTAEGVKPAVELGMRVSGNGLLTITLTGACLGEPAAEKNVVLKRLEQEIAASEPKQANKRLDFAVTLPPVSLRRSGHEYLGSAVLDCTPASISVVFRLSEDTLKSPSEARLGEARISEFDLSLKAWAGAREISDIPLVRSSDVRPPMLALPEVHLPDSGG